MSLWGESHAPNGVCDRCHLRMAYRDMVPDPNVPGLYMHENCRDNYDPYRLPTRPSEDITLQHPRPDTKFTYIAGSIS